VFSKSDMFFLPSPLRYKFPSHLLGQAAEELSKKAIP